MVFVDIPGYTGTPVLALKGHLSNWLLLILSEIYELTNKFTDFLFWGFGARVLIFLNLDTPVKLSMKI